MFSDLNQLMSEFATNMKGQPLQIVAQDGIAIAARLYEPAKTAIATALILPGIGVPQRAFRHIAAWLSERGIRCLTIDYRGMSESRSAEGVASALLTTWARRDAVAALEYAEVQWSEPVVLLGHSFGGQTLGLAESLHRVNAAVLIGSQLGQTRHWRGLSRLKIELYWRLVLPLASALCDVVPGWTGLGEPLPRAVARQWSLWGRSREWFLDHEPGAALLMSRFPRPILAYSIADDDIAPAGAVTALLERFTATVPQRHDLTPQSLGLKRLGHTRLMRPGPTERIWQDMLEFFCRHAQATPVSRPIKDASVQ